MCASASRAADHLLDDLGVSFSGSGRLPSGGRASNGLENRFCDLRQPLKIKQILLLAHGLRHFPSSF